MRVNIKLWEPSDEKYCRRVTSTV